MSANTTPSNNKPDKEIRLKGIPVSAGVCIGKLYLYTSEEIPLVPRNLTPEEIPGEIERFSDALITTRKEILQIQNSITEKTWARARRYF